VGSNNFRFFEPTQQITWFVAVTSADDSALWASLSRSSSLYHQRMAIKQTTKPPTGRNVDEGWRKGLAKKTVDVFLAVGMFFVLFLLLITFLLTTFLDTQCQRRDDITTRIGRMNAEQGTGQERDTAEGGKVHKKKMAQEMSSTSLGPYVSFFFLLILSFFSDY
jgi:hypothetical protein